MSYVVRLRSHWCYQVKRVPLRRTTVQKRAENEYSWLGMLSLEGECTNVVEGTHS